MASPSLATVFHCCSSIYACVLCSSDTVTLTGRITVQTFEVTKDLFCLFCMEIAEFCFLHCFVSSAAKCSSVFVVRFLDPASGDHLLVLQSLKLGGNLCLYLLPRPSKGKTSGISGILKTFNQKSSSATG